MPPPQVPKWVLPSFSSVCSERTGIRSLTHHFSVSLSRSFTLRHARTHALSLLCHYLINTLSLTHPYTLWCPYQVVSKLVQIREYIGKASSMRDDLVEKNDIPANVERLTHLIAHLKEQERSYLRFLQKMLVSTVRWLITAFSRSLFLCLCFSPFSFWLDLSVFIFLFPSFCHLRMKVADFERLLVWIHSTVLIVKTSYGSLGLLPVKEACSPLLLSHIAVDSSSCCVW